MEKQKTLVPADLNDGQREAYKMMVEFLESHGSDMFLLEGFGGTGKTFLVGKILSYLRDRRPNWSVGVTAPTNKAVKVLMRSGSMGKKVKYQTIHKLLGLKEKITPEGKQVFERDTWETSSIEDYNLIIVDEVSMLSDELFVELHQHSGHVKIIFMGDPAQIPPVGKDDCIPFKPDQQQLYNIRRYRLTEIMRQAHDNPIISAGFSIREDLSNPGRHVERQTVLNDRGEGVEFIDFSCPDSRQRMSALLEDMFTGHAFNDNPDHAKVVAWRNNTVNRINQLIRSIRYKDEPIRKIMIGEKLVANKPITDNYNIMLFTTNDEFEVVAYDLRTRRYATEEETIKLEYYHADVEYFDMNGRKQRRKIDILHEDSQQDFEKIAAGLRRDAVSKKGYEAKQAWVRFYNFQRQFADVGYNYAITAHKCVHEESLILTDRGWIKIKDANVGDLVSSQNSFRPITNKWTSQKSGIKFTTWTGRTIICSDEHLIKQSNNFVLAGSLAIGDSLMTPIIGCDEICTTIETTNELRKIADTCGSINSRMIKLHLTSIEFSIKYQMQLLQLGIISYIRDCNLFIQSGSNKNFLERVGFSDKSKLEKLKILSQKYKQTKQYFFDKIVNIERVGLSNMVDIEVAQLHEFNCVGFSVHNCQGSTYKHVFIMEDDIDTNQNVYERNRIKYTAFSRPSKKLYIVRK